MNGRIAEFEESDDALDFAKRKGQDFTVCPGINMPWAVRYKERHELATGNSEPTDYGSVKAEPYVDEDYDDGR